jgi:hypothetical protein
MSCDVKAKELCDNGRRRTRIRQASHQSRPVRAADAGRYADFGSGIFNSRQILRARKSLISHVWVQMRRLEQHD